MAHNPMGDGWTDDSVFENSWLNVPADSTTTNTYTISTGADDGVARRSNGGSTNSYYNTGFSNSSAKNYVGVQDDEGANDYYACYFRFNNVVA